MTEKEKKNCTNHENVVEETPKDKKGVIVWIKAHRKQLILVGISIPTIIAVTFRVKNKDALKALWQDLNEEIKKANMYSTKWFATVSDDVLDKEREKVRLMYCSSGDNFFEASRLQKLLWRFDDEMNKRAWGDEIPHAPSIHREHSWYLSNDD